VLETPSDLRETSHEGKRKRRGGNTEIGVKGTRFTWVETKGLKKGEKVPLRERGAERNESPGSVSSVKGGKKKKKKGNTHSSVPERSKGTEAAAECPAWS